MHRALVVSAPHLARDISRRLFGRLSGQCLRLLRAFPRERNLAFAFRVLVLKSLGGALGQMLGFAAVEGLVIVRGLWVILIGLGTVCDGCGGTWICEVICCDTSCCLAFYSPRCLILGSKTFSSLVVLRRADDGHDQHRDALLGGDYAQRHRHRLLLAFCFAVVATDSETRHDRIWT